MIASSISVVVVGMATSAFVQALGIWNQQSVINELTLDLDLAMSYMRHDMRLSSVGTGLMAFYPSDGSEYEAISLPLAIDDGDGLLQRDAENQIIWDKTIIYHVRPGTPYELRRTVFSPRDTNSTPAELYDQLATVVAATNDAAIAAAVRPGESMTSKTLFKNLVEMSVQPPTLLFDGYHTSPKEAGTLNFGSVVLDGGMHTLTFTVEGRNESSSGYKVGIDRLSLSATQSPREGELFTPVHTHPTTGFYEATNAGGTVIAEDMSAEGANWSGNAQLTYTASAISNQISFEIYNDAWIDSNFNEPGATLTENTSVKYDQSFTNQAPYIGDYVISLDKGIAWGADRASDGSDSLMLRGETMTVTNIIYGGTNEGASIARNGQWVRLRFDSGDYAPLTIADVELIDEETGAASNVTFAGLSEVSIPARSNAWSDWVPEFVIDKSKNYRVAMTVGGSGDRDVEMFVGAIGGKIHYRENDGSPTVPVWDVAHNLEDITSSDIAVGAFSTPAFADLDADGDSDLVIGNQNGTLSFVENVGSGGSSDWAPPVNNWWSLDVGTYSSPAFADIDADGDFDMVLGHASGSLVYYENQGDESAPVWGLATVNWLGIDVGAYSAPAFADLDGDEDLDLFVGDFPLGRLAFIENTGSPSNFTYGSVQSNYLGILSPLCHPALTDIDADDDLDLFVGGDDGKLHFYRNTGSPTNAAWGETNFFYSGLSVGTFSAPAFANENADHNSIWMETNSTVVMSYTNGAACTALLGLFELEVGYPSNGFYRSGIFDTQLAAPSYEDLNWTQVENFPAGGDVDVRVRSADTEGAIDSASWTDAKASDSGFFGSNMGNSLALLPKKRYLQYEARFRCFKPEAHTNEATAKLRDVVIHWPGPEGIVDLQVDFARGPDYGIVSAEVDGQAFLKGATIELQIFKYSRPSGTNTVTGMVEIKPLNTGK